jgi:hypothetical protein
MKPVWIAAPDLRRTFRVRANIFFVFVFPMILILVPGQCSAARPALASGLFPRVREGRRSSRRSAAGSRGQFPGMPRVAPRDVRPPGIPVRRWRPARRGGSPRRARTRPAAIPGQRAAPGRIPAGPWPASRKARPGRGSCPDDPPRAARRCGRHRRRRGPTSAQIAAELFISVRTAGSHLDRIRHKTGCRRRADPTRLALTAGPVRQRRARYPSQQPATQNAQICVIAGRKSILTRTIQIDRFLFVRAVKRGVVERGEDVRGERRHLG